MTDHYREANRRHWDDVVGVHLRSAFYDVDAFRAGGNALHRLERDELGDVRGKRLLHLQCHFGLDTLSWARLGAEVTGIDFSEVAIETARELSRSTGVPGRFIHTDLYDLPAVLDEQFDIVFTSYGALGWLDDIGRWAEIAAGYVRPGGTFYIAEIHPTALIFDDDAADELRVRYPYFWQPEPIRDDGEDYADPTATLAHAENYGWIYSLSDVVDGLIRAGLRIEHLHEFDHTVYRAFPFLESADDGTWHLPAGWPSLPMLFSIKATNPGADT